MTAVITDADRESALAIIKFAKTMIEKSSQSPEMTGETWQSIALAFAATFKEAGVKLVFNDGTNATTGVIERIMMDTPKEDFGPVFAQIFGKA